MNGSCGFFIFARAAFWSGAAVAIIIGVLSEAEIDMLILGFLANPTLSDMMALRPQSPAASVWTRCREQQDHVCVVGVSSA